MLHIFVTYNFGDEECVVPENIHPPPPTEDFTLDPPPPGFSIPRVFTILPPPPGISMISQYQ